MGLGLGPGFLLDIPERESQKRLVKDELSQLGCKQQRQLCIPHTGEAHKYRFRQSIINNSFQVITDKKFRVTYGKGKLGIMENAEIIMQLTHIDE